MKEGVRALTFGDRIFDLESMTMNFDVARRSMVTRGERKGPVLREGAEGHHVDTGTFSTPIVGSRSGSQGAGQAPRPKLEGMVTDISHRTLREEKNTRFEPNVFDAEIAGF